MSVDINAVRWFLGTTWEFLGIVTVMATLPFWFWAVGGHISLAQTMLVWMIFAVGYDLELGYTGQLSIGHSIMYGVGGYVTGIVLIHFVDSFLISVIVGCLAAVLVAAVIGWLSHQATGLYFALVTLAFTMMFFFTVTQLSITGGHDGLSGIPRFGEPLTRYYVLLGFLTVGGLAGYWLVQSPYGRILQGVRENERRLEHLGYNPMSYKLSIFVISGLYAGLAGTMLALTSGFVGPDVFFWIAAFHIVVFTLIGGPGTISGPVAAAGIFIALESIIGNRLGHWELILGAIFIAIIVFYPGGLYEMLPREVSGHLSRGDE